MTAQKKMGRPREPVENQEQAIMRAWWRKARAKYYKKNREKILKTASINLAEKKLRDENVNAVIIPEPLVRLDKEVEK